MFIYLHVYVHGHEQNSQLFWKKIGAFAVFNQH